MPYENEVPPLQLSVTEPVGCHLQAISSVGGCLSLPSAIAIFERLLKRGHNDKSSQWKGAYFTGTIVSIGDRNREVFDQTVKILTELGFKLLGVQEGAHQALNGSYKMYLYGLGFTLPGEIPAPKEK